MSQEKVSVFNNMMGQICYSVKKKHSANNHKLTDNEIEFLLHNTNYDRLEIQEWHQEFSKDCPDGKLSKKHFIKQYKKFNPTNNPEKLCDHLFRAFDTDRNGFIDFQEFLIAINLTSTNSNYRSKLAWVFNFYDIDGNGSIEKDEFRSIIECIYKILDTNDKHSYEDVKNKTDELFQQIDTDKSKTISLEEFIDACIKDKCLLDLLAPSV